MTDSIAATVTALRTAIILNESTYDTYRRIELDHVMKLVRGEIERQDRLYGEQELPFFPEEDGWHAGTWEYSAKQWREENARRLKADQVAWDGVISEALFTTLSELNVFERETDLLQVAAIVISAWTASRRRRLREGD